MRNNKRVILVVLIIQALDILSTVIAVNYLGFKEMNPIAGELGLYEFFIIKIVASFCIVYILQLKKSKTLDWIALGITSPVVVWNFINILLT
jgi:uncharacterized membrane protein